MRWLIVIFVAWSSVFSTKSMWARVETAPVPVDRVLTNLMKRVTTESDNFELFHAIARLHSLSYARGASNWMVDVATNASHRRFAIEMNQLPWDGHRLALPPEHVTASTTDAAKTASKSHLLNAIEFYKRAITIRPTNQFVHLGLGWCQIQAGQTNEAKTVLRRAVQLGQEPLMKLMLSDLYPTSGIEETIGYLIPLLDPATDADEIAKLEAIKSEASAYRTSHHAYTPLVVPLQQHLNLCDLINTNAVVTFDLDGSQIRNSNWQWITTNAAWIVHLPQGGTVTSALQMFGNVTFWMFWENGYHALGSLDDNGDGLISGEELRGIKLWQDRNCDGKCTDDEILELRQVGATALDTHYGNENGTLSSVKGARFKDGSTRATYDVVLRRMGEPNSKR